MEEQGKVLIKTDRFLQADRLVPAVGTKSCGKRFVHYGIADSTELCGTRS